MNILRSKMPIVYSAIIVCLVTMVSVSSFIASANTEAKLENLVSGVIPLNNLAEHLLVDFIHMETGLRGYEISGDDKFLEPYHAGKAQLELDLRALSDYQQQYDRLDTVMTVEALPSIRQLQDYYAGQLDLIRDGRRDTALQSVSIGKTYMDRFRAAHGKVMDEIDQIALDAHQSAHNAKRLARIVLVIGGAADAIAVILSVIIFRRAARAEKALRHSEETYRFMAESLETQNEEIIAQQEEQESTLEKLSERERELEAITGYQEKLTGATHLDAFLNTSVPAVLETLQLDAAMLVVNKAALDEARGGHSDSDNPSDTAGNPLFETIYAIGYPSSLPASRQSELYGTARRVLLEKRMLESVRNVSEQERGFHLGIRQAADYYFPLLNDRQESIGFLLLTGYLTSSSNQKVRLAQGLIRQFGLAFMAQQTNEARRRQSVKLEQLNEQLQQEKRMIEEQRDLIENILESAHEGMIMCDRHGHILFLNQRMKNFLDISHEVGESIVTAIRIWNDTPTSGQILSSVEGLLRGRTDNITERFFYTTDDGQMRHVELYATKMGDSSKRPDSGFLFVVRDRTEEEKIDEMKNEFISTVSHELRTPLSSVLGFIEIMLHRQLTPEKQRKYLQTVYKEAGRLSTLINDFLDLQRMESGKQAYHFVPVELGALLREVAEPWKAEQTHEIRLHRPEREVWVRGDADRLMQVAHNLISNAVKYSPQANRVDITIRENGSTVSFEVQDYGLGIPEEAKGSMFTKFFRVDNSDRRQIGGTGLGLSIVREIMDAHQGSIHFESTMGEGSVFTVTLNAYQVGNAEGSILLLEDDDNAAKLIQVALMKLQIPTIHVRSAEEGLLALERVDQYPPRLCIVDIHLKGPQSGWDFLTELYRHPKFHRTPVIVSTALEPPHDYYEKDSEKYLRKPFTVNKLLQVAEHLMFHNDRRPAYIFPPQDESLIRSRLAQSGIEIESITTGSDHIQIEPTLKQGTV